MTTNQNHKLMKTLICFSLFILFAFNIYAQSSNSSVDENITTIQSSKTALWQKLDLNNNKSEVTFRIENKPEFSSNLSISLSEDAEFTVIVFHIKDGKYKEISSTQFNSKRGSIIIPANFDEHSDSYCKINFVNPHYSGDISVCLIEKPEIANSEKNTLNVISSQFDATSLVQNVFAMEGELISNVQLIGNTSSIGYFYNAAEEIGFSDGIILSTGNASGCIGPNNSSAYGVSFDTDGDTDLNNLLGEETNDASVLRFNFTPQSNTLHFEFVFASDEYPEFANANFNDVFAFFVSGGPETYWMENFALIPGTNEPVSINSINNVDYPQYYIDNQDGHLNTQFDGLTQVFEVTVPVTPGYNYFIKIAVADVGDSFFDSAIFLRKRSFGTTTIVSGNVYVDANSNCIFDDGEIPAANVLVEAQPYGYVSNTDENGQYSFPLFQGEYQISPLISPVWDINCPEGGIQNITILPSDEEVIDLDLGLSSDISCPLLTVDVASGPIRPCFSTPFAVSYSNIGTVMSEGTEILLETDDIFTIESSSIPYSEIEPGIFSFEIGDIQIFENGLFNLLLAVDCDLDLVGQTRCISAEIQSVNDCNFINPGDPEFPEGEEYENTEWDHSSVSVEGICSEDTYAVFTILNTGDLGDGDMEGPSEYRIYLNDTLILINTFQLAGGVSLEIIQETFGAAVRLEADQRPGHPGNSHPNAVVEECGDSNGTSLGYVNNFATDDNDLNIDIYCRQITSSFDPNDKLVFPEGLTENHYFGNNAEFNYIINFQNTGSDTAFTVVIRDTLSQYLDLSTFRQGCTSHLVSLDISTEGVLIWTFNNIQLPDSTTDQNGSKGFVSFSIRPDYNQPITYGTQIDNRAAIYFDYNLPVITNTVDLVYWNLREIFTGNQMVILNLPQISIFPNPVVNEFRIAFLNPDDATGKHLRIFNPNGKTIIEDEISTNNQSFVIDKNVKSGIYFYEVSGEGKIIKTGKLVIK